MKKQRNNDRYDSIPSCPACGSEKVIITCRSIDYMEKEYLLQFKCNENHEWVSKEYYFLFAPKPLANEPAEQISDN